MDQMSHRTANRFKGGPPSSEAQRLAARQVAAAADEVRLQTTRRAMQKADQVAGDRKTFVEALERACTTYAGYTSPDNYQRLKAAVDRYEHHQTQWTETFNGQMTAPGNRPPAGES